MIKLDPSHPYHLTAEERESLLVYRRVERGHPGGLCAAGHADRCWSMRNRPAPLLRLVPLGDRPPRDQNLTFGLTDNGRQALALHEAMENEDN